MNIALIGYGRMGHEIEKIALKRGHSVKLIIDINNKQDLNNENLSGIDVVIEFTTPDSAFGNIVRCLENGVPVVSGTTGWLKDYPKAAELCLKQKTAFLHTTNFSIGVNLLFMLNATLAKKMAQYEEYTVSIEEIHHTKKLDAPSGTAISISEGITDNHQRYKGWTMAQEPEGGMIPIRAIREGSVPGTHTITWDSEIDKISLRHEAKSRAGLAMGAVVAAEFIRSKKGIYTMKDVLAL